MPIINTNDFWLIDRPTFGVPGIYGDFALVEPVLPYFTQSTCRDLRITREPHMVFGPNIRPIRIVSWGKRRLADFYCHGGCVLVSERVRQAVLGAGLKGFMFYPVDCIAKKGQAFSPTELQGQIWEFGLATELSFAPESRLQVQTLCESCGYSDVEQVGDGPVVVDSLGWNGEDAFTIRGTRMECYGKRFVELSRAQQFMHIDFSRPLSEVTIPKDPLAHATTEEIRAEIYKKGIIESFEELIESKRDSINHRKELHKRAVASPFGYICGK